MSDSNDNLRFLSFYIHTTNYDIRIKQFGVRMKGISLFGYAIIWLWTYIGAYEKFETEQN